MGNRLLLVGWHNVDPTPAFQATEGAGRRGFDRQLAALGRLGTVIGLSEAVDRLAVGDPLPPRSVVLTFDDGYQDSLDVAVPALARHGLPATFFLVPGFLSGRLGAWWEDLASAFEHATADVVVQNGERHDVSTVERRASAQALVRDQLKGLGARAREDAVAEIVEQLAPTIPPAPLFMNWDGARALLEAGHDVGSHSATHAILGRETPEDQAAELADSRSELETKLGRTVDLLAYPNGTADDYDDITLHHAREIGYRCAITTRPGLAARRDSRYEMRRVVLTPTTDVPELLGKVWRKATRRVRSRILR